MKKCLYCHKEYPEYDFGVALTRPDKVFRRRKCRYCYRKAKRALHLRYRKWFNNYKSKSGCQKCGFSDPRALDFHHLDPEKKSFALTINSYNHHGFNRLKEEAKKCIVLCANCHRILHFKNG